MFCFFFVVLEMFNSIFNVNQKVLVIYIIMYGYLLFLFYFQKQYSLICIVYYLRLKWSVDNDRTYIIIYPLISFCTHFTI